MVGGGLVYYYAFIIKETYFNIKNCSNYFNLSFFYGHLEKLKQFEITYSNDLKFKFPSIS